MSPKKLCKKAEKKTRKLNPAKRTKMLIRRLVKLNEDYQAEKEQREQIIKKMVEDAALTSHLKSENYNLMRKNVDLTFKNNRLKHVLQSIDSTLTACFSPLGELSSSFMQSKKSLSDHQAFIYTSDEHQDFFTSPQTPRNLNVPLPGPSNYPRAQAMVNPMIDGLTLKNPLVSLKRFKFTPDELYAIKKEMRETNSHYNNANELSPITEASTPEVRQRRRRVGGQQVNNANNSPRERANEADMQRLYNCGVPMVRLHDVSTLLNNSSIVIVNEDNSDMLQNVSSSMAENNHEDNTDVLNFSKSMTSTPINPINRSSSEAKIEETPCSSYSLTSSFTTQALELDESDDDFSTSYVSKRRKLKSVSKFSGFTSPDKTIVPKKRKTSAKVKKEKRQTKSANTSVDSSLLENSLGAASSRARRAKAQKINYKEDSLKLKKRRE